MSAPTSVSETTDFRIAGSLHGLLVFQGSQMGKKEIETLVEVARENNALEGLMEHLKFWDHMENIVARDLVTGKISESITWFGKLGISMRDSDMQHVGKKALAMALWGQPEDRKERVARVMDYMSLHMNPRPDMASIVSEMMEVRFTNGSGRMDTIDELFTLTECSELFDCSWIVPDARKANERWMEDVYRGYALRVLRGKNDDNDDMKLQSVGITIDPGEVYKHFLVIIFEEGSSKRNAVNYGENFFRYCKRHSLTISQPVLQGMFELQTALYGDQYAESAQRATLAENEERHYNNLDHTRALGAAIIHFCQYIGANLNGARPQQKALTKLMVAFDHEISGMSLNPEQRHEFVRVVKGEIAGHPENLTNIARFYSYVLEQLEIFNVRVKLPTASDIVTQCIKDRLAPGEMKLKEAERIRQEAVKAGIALCPTKVNDSELITAGFLGLLRGDGGELEEFSSLLLVIRHSWSEGERCAENMPMHLQDALDEYVQSLDEDQARGNPGMLLKTLKKLMRVSSELKHMGYRGLKLIPFAKLVVKKGLLSSANIGETCETFALLVRLIQECKADKSEAKIDTAAVQPLSPSLSTS